MPASSRAIAPRVDTSYNLNIFALLLALRVANALVVKTFFQPDEYFQSLEPAWHIAYGHDSGAWITWVRLLPMHFSTIYRLVLCSLSNLFHQAESLYSVAQ